MATRLVDFVDHHYKVKRIDFFLYERFIINSIGRNSYFCGTIFFIPLWDVYQVILIDIFLINS